MVTTDQTGFHTGRRHRDVRMNFWPARVTFQVRALQTVTRLVDSFFVIQRQRIEWPSVHRRGNTTAARRDGDLTFADVREHTAMLTTVGRRSSLSHQPKLIQHLIQDLGARIRWPDSQERLHRSTQLRLSRESGFGNQPARQNRHQSRQRGPGGQRK
jgi:hypothetical protein